MSDEAQKTIQAGRFYLDSIKDDPELQARWLRRVQAGRVVGQQIRAAVEPMNAARDAVASMLTAISASQENALSTLSEPLQVYHQLEAALGDALCNAQFDRLRVLVERYPELKPSADELEQGVRESRQSNEQRLHHFQAGLAQLCSLTPPAITDPEFWRSITPLGERVRDAVREAMLEQAPKKPTEPIKADEAQRRAEAYIKNHDFPGVNALAKQCNCSAATIRKVIARSEELQRAQTAHQLQKIKPRATPQTLKDASWGLQVDEALRQLIEYAPESERAKLNSPDFRDQLAKMESDALATLVDEAKEQVEQRKRAANRATAGRARARTDQK